MRAILLVVAAMLGIYCVGVGYLAWQQRRFLYDPDHETPDVQMTAMKDARAVRVHTVDGLRLNAWWAPPVNSTVPVILYLHGNAGNIGDRAHRFAQVHGFGWGVLLLDYRGYGGNPGSPTEVGLFEDARAAYATLRSYEIAAPRVVLWGESLGTGVAVELASRFEVGAVLLESPFTSIAAVAQVRFPYVPVDWLLQDRFDLIGRIGMVHVPVLVMTGGRDMIVPPAMGRAVFAAAHEPKVFWFAPEAGHTNLAASGELAVVHEFVVDHLVH